MKHKPLQVDDLVVCVDVRPMNPRIKHHYLDRITPGELYRIREVFPPNGKSHPLGDNCAGVLLHNVDLPAHMNFHPARFVRLKELNQTASARGYFQHTQ